MALDENNNDYFYNLGRCVAVVETMTGMDLYRKVSLNAAAYLPFWLNKALFDDRHNLHKELLPLANVVLMTNGQDIPKGVMTANDSKEQFPLGYYAEKKHLEDTYHGIYGREETIVTENTPETVSPVAGNELSDLAR